jgi:hypothetical protein
MTFQVEITAIAEAQVEIAYRWYRERNPEFTDRWFRELTNTFTKNKLVLNSRGIQISFQF